VRHELWAFGKMLVNRFRAEKEKRQPTFH
jgi:hypothetical protein